MPTLIEQHDCSLATNGNNMNIHWTSHQRHEVMHFLALADKLPSKRPKKPYETQEEKLLGELSVWVYKWSVFLPTRNFIDCWIETRRTIQQHCSAVNEYDARIRKAVLFMMSSPPRSSIAGAEFEGIDTDFFIRRPRLEPAQIAYLLQSGLRQRLPGPFLRGCLDHAVGIRWLNSAAEQAPEYCGVPPSVKFVTVAFFGKHNPFPQTQIDFDVCKYSRAPLTSLQQLKDMIDEQMPLPRGWRPISAPLCIDPDFYHSDPLYGEQSMPAWEFEDGQLKRRSDVLQLERQSDLPVSVNSAGQADIKLEAVSPSRTTRRFLYELVRVKDGKSCVVYVDLTWKAPWYAKT